MSRDPLTTHGIGVASMAWSVDDKSMASGAIDEKVRLWNVDTAYTVGDALEAQYDDWILSVALDRRESCGQRSTSGDIACLGRGNGGSR